MKKRFFIIISVAVLLVLTFSSCGKKEKWSLDESVKVGAVMAATEKMDEYALEKALSDRQTGKISGRVTFSPYSENDAPYFGIYFIIKDGDEKLDRYVRVLETYEDKEDVGNTEKATYVGSILGGWDDKDNLVFDAIKNGTPFALCCAGEVDPLTHARPSVYFITEDSYEIYWGEPVENPERYFKDIYMNAPDLTELAK